MLDIQSVNANGVALDIQAMLGSGYPVKEATMSDYPEPAARAAAYNSMVRRRDRKARQALDDLTEALVIARRRMDSPRELDGSLVDATARVITEAAASFAEAAHALDALREVSILVIEPAPKED